MGCIHIVVLEWQLTLLQNTSQAMQRCNDVGKFTAVQRGLQWGGCPGGDRVPAPGQGVAPPQCLPPHDRGCSYLLGSDISAAVGVVWRVVRGVRVFRPRCHATGRGRRGAPRRQWPRAGGCAQRGQRTVVEAYRRQWAATHAQERNREVPQLMSWFQITLLLQQFEPGW